MNFRRPGHQVFFQFVRRREEYDVRRIFWKGHDPKDRERPYADVHGRWISCLCGNASELIWIRVHQAQTFEHRAQSGRTHGSDGRSQLRLGREDQGKSETHRCGKEGHIRFRGRKTYEHFNSGTHESVYKDMSGAFQEEDTVFFEGHRDYGDSIDLFGLFSISVPNAGR